MKAWKCSGCHVGLFYLTSKKAKGDMKPDGQWFEASSLHCMIFSSDKKLYSTLSLSTQGPVIQSMINLTQD